VSRAGAGKVEPEPLRIERASVGELPSVDYLVRLADRVEWLLLQVPTTITVGASEEKWTDAAQEAKERLIARLVPLLPGHIVFDSGVMLDEAERRRPDRHTAGVVLRGLSRFTIRRLVSEAEVEAHRDALLAAIHQYRTLANDLMPRLAERLGAPAASFAADPLFWRRFGQAGRLDGEWGYFFHGVDCSFTNQRTGQNVEARQGFGGAAGVESEVAFGVIDPGFLLRFLATTEEFAPLASLLRDSYHNATRVLEVLETSGDLRRVEGAHGISRGWITASDPSDQSV